MHFMQMVELMVEQFVNHHEHEIDINMCNLDYPNSMSLVIQYIQQLVHAEAIKNTD